MSEDQDKTEQGEEKVVGIVTDRVSEITCVKCGCEIDVADLEPFVRVECPDCANIEIVPARLGAFLLLDLIGTGGMGGVYQARDQALGRNVAIKVMLRSLGADAKFVENFRREAQSAARLNHPNIVQIYSFGQEKGQPYIVMELVAGQGLDKMIDPERQLPQDFVMRVGLDIAQGLAAADEAGLIHGDIKPENILLDDKDKAKLVDFGIAAFANQSVGRGSIWGTPYYIAPEKVKRQKVDARADIYSLGATLYHALAGKPPFEGTTPIEVVKARLNHSPRPLSELRPRIDRNVERIIMRTLEPEPSHRYPTYASLIGDLKRTVDSLGGSHKPPTIKTGRLVVAKKQSGLIPMPPPEPVKGKPREKGSKILIKKTPSVIGAAMSARATGLHGSAADARGQTGQRTPERPKKKRSKAKGWVMLIIFVLLGLGGLIYYAKTENDKRVEIRKARLDIERNMALVTNSYGQLVAVVTNIQVMARTGESCLEKASNAVFVVLGEVLPEWKPAAPAADTSEPPPAKSDAGKPDAGKPEPGKPPAAKPDAAKPDAAKPGPAKPDAVKPGSARSDPANPGAARPEIAKLEAGGPAAPPAAPAPTKPATKGPVAKPPADDESDAPPGELTREQLDRMRQGKSPKPAEKPAEAKSGEKPGDKPATKPEERILKQDPEIKVLAQKVQGAVYDLMENRLNAENMAKQAELTAGQCLAVRSSLVAAQRERRLIAVRQIQDSTAEQLKQVEKNLASAKELQTASQGILQGAEKTLQKVLDIQKDVVAKREAEKKAKEDEERRIKDEGERKAAEEKHKIQVQKESEMVIAVRAEALLLARQHKYQDIVKNMTEKFGAFETDEGKAAGKLLIDQYTSLTRMKEQIIDRLNAEPFDWGWIHPKQDVLGADNDGVKLKARKVPWSEVSMAQMLAFIDHYLANPTAKIKLQADLNLGAAIFCYEQGEGNDTATKKAAEYARKVLKIRPEQEAELKKLLPPAVREIL